MTDMTESVKELADVVRSMLRDYADTVDAYCVPIEEGSTGPIEETQVARAKLEANVLRASAAYLGATGIPLTISQELETGRIGG